MIKIHFTRKEHLHELTERLLSEELGHSVEIAKTPEGKPYVEGNEIYFSLSHSGKKGVVALNDSPVGVDLEYFGERDYPTVLSRYTERERQEIFTAEDFIRHWTAKEAFIKMHGYTLASAFKHTEYFGGQIYFKGEEQPCEIKHYKLGKKGILTICAEGR